MWYVVIALMVVALGVGLALATGRINIPEGKEKQVGILAVTAIALLALLSFLVGPVKLPSWLLRAAGREKA